MPPPPRRPCSPLTFLLHGLRASVLFDSPRLADLAATGFGPTDLAGRADVEGSVLPYAERDVLRHVSADAVRVASVQGTDPLLELYRSGERFWLVDERWGLCEINLLKRSWRSFVLADSPLDHARLFEAAVLWPLAQLARASGLHLVPASAVGRDGRGVLILSPFDVTPELDALSAAGVGVIGRRWACLRESGDGGVMLLPAGGVGRDLPGATCRLVLLVEPMRRPHASAKPVNAAAGREGIKDAWPVPLLSAAGASGVGGNRLAASLARSCAVHRVRLGRDGGELAKLLVGPATPTRAKRAA